LALTEDDISLLIEGCKKNDRKAQELLYRKFYVVMAALCARYTSDRQDGMQVLNDGFLKVFRRIASYDPSKGNLYTWIRKIMINTALDLLKKEPFVYTGDIGEMAMEPAVENSIVQKMDADQLLELVRGLPPATQLVFNLHTVDGYNHREIAEMLGISEGTSRWHLSGARKQLKQAIVSMQQ
jgi:RNA polymerase sigma factor (sigma-70 family)